MDADLLRRRLHRPEDDMLAVGRNMGTEELEWIGMTPLRKG
jgi:hypothetical protein